MCEVVRLRENISIAVNCVEKHVPDGTGTCFSVILMGQFNTNL